MELWLLPAAKAVDALELPGWSRLLARADRLATVAPGLDAALLSAGVRGRIPWAALCAEAPDEAPWLIADLVHVRPDMNGARLLACAVDHGEADCAPLFEALRPWLAEEGIELQAVRGGRALLRCPADVPDPVTPAPDQLLGCDLRVGLPANGSWQRRINEWQMLLAQQPGNQQRELRGLPSWNTLWCWGYGQRGDLPSLPPHQWDSSDPLLQALASVASPGPIWRDLRDPRRLARAWSEGQRPSDAILRADDGAGWRLRGWHRLRVWRR